MYHWKETGWVCPNCKKVYSPYVDECKDCNKPIVRVGILGKPTRGNTIDFRWLGTQITTAPLYETKTPTLP